MTTTKYLGRFAACGGFTSLWIRSLWSVPPFFQSTHPTPAPQYPTHPPPAPNILSNNITTHCQWRNPSRLVKIYIYLNLHTPSTSQLKLSLPTSQRILPTCVHQRRKALRERMIWIQGEESIGSLMNSAAKWGSLWSSLTWRKSLLMLLKIVESSIETFIENHLRQHQQQSEEH